MDYLGYCEKEIQDIGGFYTAKEIVGQPTLWRSIFKMVVHRKEELKAFFNRIGDIANCNIILTGAGSSAFVGEVIEGAFIKNVSQYSRAVATTSIVTHPELYFFNNRPTLLISFARSGNSPESVAAISLANNTCNEVFHLVVTCNPAGKMIGKMDVSKDYLFLLPEEANDVGLAMTGSFTGMLLAGYLISRLNDVQLLENEIDIIVAYGNAIITNDFKALKELANLDFNRVVFLGSGPLLGIARESHLKVQELTNGIVMCNYDSYLGLRHGPKVVIDSKTIVVFLTSNDYYVQRYEKDLIHDVVSESLGLRTVGVSEKVMTSMNIDLQINQSGANCDLDIYLFSIVSALPAQILGFYKSVQLGCTPDSPSENGSISRVVRGVNLYSYYNKVLTTKHNKII